MPATHAFGVNKDRVGVAELFQDRPRNVVLRFPAIIERDNRASGWNAFLAALPGEQVLQADDCNPFVFQLLHLFLEIFRSDFGVGMTHFIHKPVITKDDDLRGLIDNWLARFRRNRCGCSSRSRTRRRRGLGLRRERIVGVKMEETEPKEQDRNSKSTGHKRSIAFMRARAKYK